MKLPELLAHTRALEAAKAAADSRAARVPETPQGYAVNLPADFKLPDGMTLPDGVEKVEINPQDPRIAAARTFAKQIGLDQSGFEQLLAFGVTQDLAAEQHSQTALKGEAEKLGSRHKERIGAVTAWIRASLPESQANALVNGLFLADQVSGFEALMSIARKDPPGSPGAARESRTAEITDEAWAKMSPSDRISHARKAGAKQG